MPYPVTGACSSLSNYLLFVELNNPFLSSGRVRGLKRSTRLGFWSSGLGQHSRTAATSRNRTQSTTFCTQVLTLPIMGIRYYEERTQHIGNRTLDLSPPRSRQSDHHTTRVRVTVRIRVARSNPKRINIPAPKTRI